VEGGSLQHVAWDGWRPKVLLGSDHQGSRQQQQKQKEGFLDHHPWCHQHQGALRANLQHCGQWCHQLNYWLPQFIMLGAVSSWH